MSNVLRTALLPILATAVACQPQLAPQSWTALRAERFCARAVLLLTTEAARLPAWIVNHIKLTRNP